MIRHRRVFQMIGGGLAAVMLGWVMPVAAQGPTIVQVAAAGDFSCALDNTGQVWCWGSNRSGQLGDGTTTRRSTP